MTKFQCYDDNGDIVKHIYQWDTGRHIEVRDLDVWNDAVVYFDFSTIEHDMVYSVQATANDGVYSAVIPDEILMQKHAILLYVYQATPQNENFTIETIRISIIPRQKPNNYTYTETPPIVRIPDGLVVDDGSIYITSDGDEVGDGADFANGGAIAVIPDCVEYLSSFYNTEPECDIATGFRYEPIGNTITAYTISARSSKTYSISLDNDSLVVAVIACPYDKNIGVYRMEPSNWSADGWAHNYDSVCTHEETLTDDPDQRDHNGTRVFSKTFSAGSHSISFVSDDIEFETPAASSITILCIPFASGVSVYGEESISQEYEAPIATGNNRLYVITQNIWYGYGWSYSNYNTFSGDGLERYSNTLGHSWLNIWYDYHPEDAQSPTISHDASRPSENFAVALTVDILWN